MSLNPHGVICPCGSGLPFSACCEPYFDVLGQDVKCSEAETLLLDWQERYSPPLAQSFREKVGSYVFRVSHYLDIIVDQYLHLGFPRTVPNQEAVDNAFFFIKNNILLSLFASLSCLSQGLYLQSGTLLRSLIEDCLVLLDLSENKAQLERFLCGKYSTNGLVSRVRRAVPDVVVGWYGSFSANFAHLGPLHSAPYLPRACYTDNIVLVLGIQSIVRATVAFHMAMERLYFDQTAHPMLWKRIVDQHGTRLVFDEDSDIFAWTEKLGQEIVARYPLDERKEGFVYSTRSYRLK